MAAIAGGCEAIGELVRLGLHVDNELSGSGLAPLHLAAHAGQLDAVQKLIHLKAALDLQDANALGCVKWAYSSHAEII